ASPDLRKHWRAGLGIGLAIHGGGAVYTDVDERIDYCASQHVWECMPFGCSRSPRDTTVTLRTAATKRAGLFSLCWAVLLASGDCRFGGRLRADPASESPHHRVFTRTHRHRGGQVCS